MFVVEPFSSSDWLTLSFNLNSIFRYHELYLRAKGNTFKNKRNLMEYIFKKKTENTRAKQIALVFALSLLISVFNHIFFICSLLVQGFDSS